MPRTLWYRSLRMATAATCGYETIAIIADTPRMPTLSRLSARHKWVGPALVGALIVHLVWPLDHGE